MKIYNKRGFVFGIFWTIGGSFCLYRDIVSGHDFLPQQIKSLIFSLLMLLIGITCLVRAFSKRATYMDRIEDQDERNHIIKLKTDAKVGSVLVWLQLPVMLAGILGWAFTKNILFAFLAVSSGLIISLSFLLGIIFAIYYERHE